MLKKVRSPIAVESPNWPNYYQRKDYLSEVNIMVSEETCPLLKMEFVPPFGIGQDKESPWCPYDRLTIKTDDEVRLFHKFVWCYETFCGVYIYPAL